MLFRWFVLHKTGKPIHKPSPQANPQWIEPDAMDPTRRIPTIHTVRMEDEFARLKRLERERYRRQRLLRELGEDVERSMTQPLHLGGEHDAPTLSDQAHRTDKIPELHEEE